MKLIDTTGRQMLVDLVYKHPQLGWLLAPATKLKGRGTQNVRVPHGRYAAQVCSLNGADVILFENGQKLIQTTVPSGTQIIEFDANRTALEFRPAGEAREIAATDVVVLASDEATGTADGDTPATESTAEQAAFVGPQAPAGHGLVYIVVRMAKENSPHGEPPQEEFEIAFQIREPAEHDNFFAENFSLVEQAPDLPNKLDPMSLQPADPAMEQHRPHFNCRFSGCKH